MSDLMRGLPARQIKRRALALSELGFGGASIGNLYRATSDEEAAAAVEQAFASGIRYFDTAPHYGLGLSYLEIGDKHSAEKEEQVLRKLKSRLADRLTGMLLVPAGQRNKVF